MRPAKVSGHAASLGRLIFLPFLLLAPNAFSQNPVPFVNQPLVPSAVAPGGPDFTLTVNGPGFVSAGWRRPFQVCAPEAQASKAEIRKTCPARSEGSKFGEGRVSSFDFQVSSFRPGGGNAIPGAGVGGLRRRENSYSQCWHASRNLLSDNYRHGDLRLVNPDPRLEAHTNGQLTETETGKSKLGLSLG